MVLRNPAGNIAQNLRKKRTYSVSSLFFHGYLVHFDLQDCWLIVIFITYLIILQVLQLNHLSLNLYLQLFH